MTLVEFFDKEALDNAAGVLLLRPERLVLLYSECRCGDFADALGKILEKRNIVTEIITEKVDTSRIDTAKEKLEEITERFPDCDFDIAGGNDIMLVAIGEVAKKHGLPLHCVNVREKSVKAVNLDKEYRVFDAQLSVSELIDLYSGRCTNETREKAACVWERNAAAEKDIEAVWEICKKDPGAWNGAIGKHKNGRADRSASVWARLKRAGMVAGSGEAIRYKNSLVKYLLSRQGTALEMYTFICAKASGCFDDGQSGALLDWKGKREVENEIDVLLTRGLEGYFISCKNGMTDSSELYKLNTVATRFGGRYAKKILVLSFFEPDRSFVERAEELGIRIIKNVRHLQKKDFIKRLTDQGL